MLTFGEVVAVSAEIGATRSRLSKVAALAGILRRADGEAEVRAVVSFLTGAPRQGRIGAGWRTIVGVVAEPAVEAGLTVTGVDAAFEEVSGTGGVGSSARRAQVLGALFAAATVDEQRFLRALLTGELRQGALEGVMLDAVAKAGEVPGDAVRRAFMLSGALPATAWAALSGGAEALSAFRLELGRP
ncbi:MAG: ATP-dependent DNA ligase, partial [Actinomycetota bacterium]|nr:ATP-dependent DNA ligase [Actinomycetota bacterium]